MIHGRFNVGGGNTQRTKTAQSPRGKEQILQFDSTLMVFTYAAIL